MELCLRTNQFATCSKGVAAKGGNTFAHLRKYHPLKYVECKSQKQMQSKSMPTQQTLEEAISSGEKYQRRWQQLTDHVTYMIAKDNMMPLNTVEKSGFKRMVYKKYELPSHKYVSQMAIPTLYATRANVESELSKGSTVLCHDRRFVVKCWYGAVPEFDSPFH